MWLVGLGMWPGAHVEPEHLVRDQGWRPRRQAGSL